MSQTDKDIEKRNWRAALMGDLFGTALGQRIQETLPVRIVLEDSLPPIALIHHVIKGSLILHSQLARHRPKSAKTTAPVSIVRTDTFSRNSKFRIKASPS